MTHRLLSSALLLCTVHAPLTLAREPETAPHATDDPRFCADRPDLAESACTVQPGRVLVEVSTVDWERETHHNEREDYVGIGSFVVRAGVSGNTELQFGWTPFAHVRATDRDDAESHSYSGVGDAFVGAKQNLQNADGHGVAIALLPFATLPVGGAHIGEGDWGAGLSLPITFSLGHHFELATTTTVRAAVNHNGEGRHLAYGGVVGLIAPLTESLHGSVEIGVEKSREAHHHATHAVAAASLVYELRHSLQIDAAAEVGLNEDSPDFRMLTGFAVQF